MFGFLKLLNSCVWVFFLGLIYRDLKFGSRHNTHNHNTVKHLLLKNTVKLSFLAVIHRDLKFESLHNGL